MVHNGKDQKLLIAGGATAVAGATVLLISCVGIASAVAGIIGGNNSSDSSYIDNVSIMEGLPPWVTSEIILTCLDLQDKYGIYASVTIAQAQQEAGEPGMELHCMILQRLITTCLGSKQAGEHPNGKEL